MPPRLPVPAEQLVNRVVTVPAGMCRYRSEPFTAWVLRIREDISVWYDGDWVWIDVDELDHAGAVIRCLPVLVHVDVFASAVVP